jgi:beta-glucosidase
MRNIKQQAESLVAAMTLEEKVSQMLFVAAPIKRLGIPAYNWWNEGLHGVARAGTATVFPQAIALAATFNEKLLFDVAEIIAVEGRAKYHAHKSRDDRDIYKGLTYWSPNINIFRDPRWGRGQETYGEDPYLTATLGKAFVRGLQGSGKYMKLAACAKHYAVHSGPESVRHEFDAIADTRDLWDTYLPAFRALVTESKVESVMGAYNRTNGEPCCASPTLLTEILREKWGFKGHVVSDCWAIRDFHTKHNLTHTMSESIALALKHGCDLNCGSCYIHMMTAYNEGLVTEDEITVSAIRLFTTRFKLGLFDEDAEPIHYHPYTAVACKEHTEFALQACRESLVLLHNKNNILPLNADKYKTVGVIGPNADSRDMLVGNYNGTPHRAVTILEGLRRHLEGTDTRILYSEGCHLWRKKVGGLSKEGDRLSEAAAVADASDVVILCLGLDWRIEGEEGDTGNEFGAGDKDTLDFPQSQLELFETVAKSGKPIVLLSATGSAMNFTQLAERANAIVQVWYPGAEGGRAIAELLYGVYSPSGKLPVTIVRDVADLPAFTDYSMENRTYRYMKKPAFYPFGFGLSYTKFDYTFDKSESEMTFDGKGEIMFNASVQNFYDMNGRETVQCYVRHIGGRANCVLRGVQVIDLKVGEKKNVCFTLTRDDFLTVNEAGEPELLKGSYNVCISGGQPDERTIELTGMKPVIYNVTVC